MTSTSEGRKGHALHSRLEAPLLQLNLNLSVCVCQWSVVRLCSPQVVSGPLQDSPGPSVSTGCSLPHRGGLVCRRSKVTRGRNRADGLRAEKWGRRTACSSVRSTVQNRIIGPDFHQICDASHVQASGHLPKPLSAGGDETAEQSTRAEFLQPDQPTLGTAPRPIVHGF